MYCIKCGTELPDGARFCMKCGANLEVKNKQYESNGKREQTYAGKVNKCPCCGEILESFVTHCSSCGYELRGVAVSDSVKEFNNRLQSMTNQNEQVLLIRSFPIPNTKEDIFEFMILASTNIDVYASCIGTSRKELSDAWLVKFNQCYKKAEVLFVKDTDFIKIQEIYNNVTERYANEKKARYKREITGRVLKIVSKNILIICGFVILLLAVGIDKNGGNSVLAELIGCGILSLSAFVLPMKKASLDEVGIGALSGVLLLVVAKLLENGVLLKLCGVGILFWMVITFMITVVGEDK